MKPIAEPIPRPTMIRPQLPIPSSSRVVMTATTMPAAAIRLPCLAVLGWVPRFSPMMKRLKARM